MFTKFVVAFSILALAAAIAGSIPAKGFAGKVRLTEPVIVNGTTLKAGDYRLTVNADKVTFTIDKTSLEIPASIETGQNKYTDNEVEYEHKGNQTTIKQICLGGTKTRLVFN